MKPIESVYIMSTWGDDEDPELYPCADCKSDHGRARFLPTKYQKVQRQNAVDAQLQAMHRIVVRVFGIISDENFNSHLAPVRSRQFGR